MHSNIGVSFHETVPLKGEQGGDGYIWDFFSNNNLMHVCARNCLLGKAYQIKICDFGSDCPEFRRDYTEMEDGLLVPLRWMAWESVIEVRAA